MHGGRSTGPRTPKGLADLRAARTIHGNDGAEARARDRYRLTVLRRARVDIAAQRYQDHLPPAFVARLYGHAPELMPPPRPTGGITAAQDRVRRHAVAAALAPWKRAIAAARAAERAARAAARLAKPHAPVGARPPRGAGVPEPHAPIPGAAAAAAVPGRRPPGKTPCTSPAHAAPRDAGVPEPRAPIPGAADPAAAARANCPPQATAAASPADATQGRRPTPPRPAGGNPLAARRGRTPCTRRRTHPQRCRRAKTPCTNSRPGRARHPARAAQPRRAAPVEAPATPPAPRPGRRHPRVTSEPR